MNPEATADRGAAISKGWAKPGVKARARKTRRAIYADPERGKNVRAALKLGHTPEVRAKATETMRLKAKAPGYSEFMGRIAREAWANPKTRPRMVNGRRLAMASPERRQQKSEEKKKWWAERWRPADWWDKPTDYRIFATELVAKDSMTNKELAERLDRSRILRCPYAVTWKDALGTRGFLLLVNNVRKWIKRQGGRQKAAA